MLLRSAIIPTPRQESRASARNVFSRALTFLACAALLSLAASIANAQTSTHKKKTSHAHSPACQTGCKTDTTAPTLDSSTPEDAAAQQELALLARNLHHGTTADYDKLAAYANKHAAGVWGQRASLALGYDDYSKARFLKHSPGSIRPRPIRSCASTRSSGPRKPIVLYARMTKLRRNSQLYCGITRAQS